MAKGGPLSDWQLKREGRDYASYSSALDGKLVRVKRSGLAESYGNFAIRYMRQGHARTAAMHARVAAHHAFGCVGRWGKEAAAGHYGPGSCRCKYL